MPSLFSPYHFLLNQSDEEEEDDSVVPAAPVVPVEPVEPVDPVAHVAPVLDDDDDDVPGVKAVKKSVSEGRLIDDDDYQRTVFRGARKLPNQQKWICNTSTISQWRANGM